MPAEIRWGAIAWMLAIQFFLTQLIPQLAWPAYSMLTNDISTLGTTICGNPIPAPDGMVAPCSPLGFVFNTGLALQGLLALAGAILTRAAWPRRRLTSSGLWLLAIGGVGTALAGLSPYDVNLALHALGAITNFIITNIGFITLGLAIRPSSRALAAFSIAAGILSLAGFALYVTPGHLGLARGIAERVTAYPQTLWFIVMGLALLMRRSFRQP